jgi:toxin FitB
MKTANEWDLFPSVVSLAELRYGAERLARGKRRAKLEQWLEYELPLRFEGRILGVDPAIADDWGRVAARCESIGRPISAIDCFLAATAEVHALTLVTGDAQYFDVLKAILNPWT